MLKTSKKKNKRKVIFGIFSTTQKTLTKIGYVKGHKNANIIQVHLKLKKDYIRNIIITNNLVASSKEGLIRREKTLLLPFDKTHDLGMWDGGLI